MGAGREPCGWKAAWLMISPSVLFHVTWHYPELKRMAETTKPVLNIFSSSCDRILEKKLKNWQWAIGLQTEFAKEGPRMEKYRFFYFIFFKEKMHVSTFSPNSGFIEHLNKSDHRYNKQWWPIINFVFSGQVVNWPCVRCSSFWGIAKAFSNTIISNKLFFPCIQHARRASLLVNNTTLPDNICSHIYCLLVN